MSEVDYKAAAELAQALDDEDYCRANLAITPQSDIINLARAYLAQQAELAAIRETLFSGLDRDRDDISTPHLATVAINAIAWRDTELSALKVKVAGVAGEMRSSNGNTNNGGWMARVRHWADTLTGAE